MSKLLIIIVSSLVFSANECGFVFQKNGEELFLKCPQSLKKVSLKEDILYLDQERASSQEIKMFKKWKQKRQELLRSLKTQNDQFLCH